MTIAYAYYPTGVIPSGDVVWVFGSDLTGKHSRGDAKIAANHFGAVNGVFSGETGNAYAIPTRNDKRQALPISDIAWEVKAFLSFAARHPGRSFVVTRVGNGMAGLDDRRIAPLFKGASTNCLFSEAWRAFLEPSDAPVKA